MPVALPEKLDLADVLLLGDAVVGKVNWKSIPVIEALYGIEGFLLKKLSDVISKGDVSLSALLETSGVGATPDNNEDKLMRLQSMCGYGATLDLLSGDLSSVREVLELFIWIKDLIRTLLLGNA